MILCSDIYNRLSGYLSFEVDLDVAFDFFETVSGYVADNYGCISVLTMGSFNRDTVWFTRAIKARDPKDRIILFTYYDMDWGGFKIAHQLARNWTEEDTIFGRLSLAEYLHIRFQTCWVGMFPSEFNRLNLQGATYKPMTLTVEQQNRIDNWRNNFIDDIIFSGDGPRRNAEIDAMIQGGVSYNLSKTRWSMFLGEIGTAIENSICPEKWQGKAKKRKQPSKRHAGGGKRKREENV